MAEVIPLQENYGGRSYSSLASDWWLWICGIPPDDRHPLNAEGETQTGEGEVRFLAGTFGGFGTPIQRNCKIPPGKAIFFPAVNVICCTQEQDQEEGEGNTTEEKLLNAADKDMDKVTSMEVRINGRQVPNLENYRVKSRPFDLLLRGENILASHGHPEATGPGKAVTVGYYLLLRPLPPGTYEIYIKATGEPTHGPDPFDSEVTYTVEVTNQ
jgi:hypothetical protein